jgi:bifunctional UDP-N-acetylglucosamine pyrophosphorylase / glucosamine-1-phosphate N-acetyltransferase
MKLKNLAAVVLAGGKGKRMQSHLPKVLHTLADQPMVFYTLETLKKLKLPIFVVVQNEESPVKREIEANFQVQFCYQITPLGTGHAVKSAIPQIPKDAETVLVLNGDDSAFYTVETLKKFIKSHLDNNAILSAMTLEVEQNDTIGRVIRDKEGNFLQILELKEYLQSGLKSNEINCGCYHFNVKWLNENINKISVSATGEYYITDLLNIAKSQNDKINLYPLENSQEWVGINTQSELIAANSLMASRTIKSP